MGSTCRAAHAQPRSHRSHRWARLPGGLGVALGTAEAEAEPPTGLPRVWPLSLGWRHLYASRYAAIPRPKRLRVTSGPSRAPEQTGLPARPAGPGPRVPLKGASRTARGLT